jgi:hypothetical protein
MVRLINLKDNNSTGPLPSKPTRRKNNMQEWELANLIKQEHQEFREQGIQRPQKQRRKEFQYYTDFVKHNTQGTNLDVSVSLLVRLSTSPNRNCHDKTT